MFGFIKFIQDFISKIKSNKRIWFSIILILSIVGIISSFYLITTMTSRVSNEVYESMSDGFKLDIKQNMTTKNKEFIKLAIVLQSDKNIENSMKQNNSRNLLKIEKNLNKNLKKSGFDKMFIKLYSKNDVASNGRNTVGAVLESKESIFGVEVMQDGVFYIYIMPLIVNGKLYGIIQIKEGLDAQRKNFLDIKGEFAFVLNKKMLPQLSIKTKKGKYKEIASEFVIEQTSYDSEFVAELRNMGNIDFKKMISDGFALDGAFFTTFKVVTDLNGVEVGYIVVGQRVEKSGSFVKLADNMTKQVTIVALGLIISIMLFMF